MSSVEADARAVGSDADADSCSYDDDDDETWALELEEELLTGSHNVTNPTALGLDDTKPATRVASASASALTTAVAQSQPPAPPSLANDLPQEVLVNIVGFAPVGRVSKAWSLASSTLARQKYSTRLTETLLCFTTDAVAIAQEVEAELFAAYDQRLKTLTHEVSLAR